MSPSEIAFLALGLAVGATAGAALLASVRPRSPFRPVVKVTVTPHAMTPAERVRLGARVLALNVPAPGSPDDAAHDDPDGEMPRPRDGAADPPAPPPGTTDRTIVPSSPTGIPLGAVGIPIAGGSRPAAGPLGSALGAGVAVADRPDTVLGTAALLGPAMPVRVDVGSSLGGLAVRSRPPVPELRPSLAPNPVRIPILAGRAPSGRSPKPTGTASAAADACADERTVAASACATADEARDAARRLADELRDARRGHADLQARVEEAGMLADPRRLAAEKERLHSQFKAVHVETASADEAEAAARDWLTAVSAANSAARDAARRVQTGTDELRRQAAALERLDLDANAARVAAERAEDACRTARESLAACEERQAALVAPGGGEPGPLDEHWPGSGEPDLDRGASPRAEADRVPLILRVLRGDRAAREDLVGLVASGDEAGGAEWQVRIARFVDAVTARAIEDGYLATDPENPFWRLFTDEERHEIVQALSALGFRFDGMRGFADDRVPSARDLSLAVGYAGLDRMRIRSWPGETALAELFAGASVRADLWLADQADDLSIGRLEAALGARAGGLADLWNAWGRVRPAMLEER